MLRILVISLFMVKLMIFGFWDKQPAVQQKASVKPAVAEKSNIPTIHLFSEMMEDQGLMSDSRQCFSLGPFHSVEEVDEVYASLQDVTVNITERQSQALVEQGYWVYLPPFNDLVEANQSLFSLQALGLKDIGVIYNGEWTNAISLGYFRRQGNAVKRKKSLEDRDYSPLIRVRRQAEDRFWLDYEQNPGSDLIALDMQNRPNDFMQRALPCPEQEEPAQVVKHTAAQPIAQPVEQVATAVSESNEPEPVEVADVPPQDNDPAADEAQQEEPQPEASAGLPLPENSGPEAGQNEEPLAVDIDDSSSNNIDSVQAVQINEAYLLRDNDTQPLEKIDQGLVPGINTDPADTDLNQDENDDPNGGDEIDFDVI
jgi:hypothetical protein